MGYESNLSGNSQVIISDSKRAAVYVEDFSVKGGDIDDGDRILRAVDEAPVGARLILDPAKRSPYELRNIDIFKSLNVELNGVSIWANPYAVQKPLFNFKGSVDTPYLLSTDVTSPWTRSITVAGAESIFQKGDPILIGDLFVTQKWSPGGGDAYSGRYEQNTIIAVSGDTITLSRQIEWPYAMTYGAFVQKINYINLPKVLGGGALIREIDPGAPTSGATAPANPGKGHLFQFEYCQGATIERVNVEGWQMHIINNHFCNRTTISKIHARNAFYPSSGGHGYVVRDDNSSVTLVQDCYGHTGRHGVDWSRSYDGVSQNNVFENMLYTSFYTHGTGAKRIKSIDDTVLGGTGLTEGWGHGDGGFSSDYGFEIVRPKYRGIGTGINATVGSQGLRVIDPDIFTRGGTGILITRGVKDFYLEGGIVEQYNAGTGNTGLKIDITSGASSPIEYPSNATIKKTIFKNNAGIQIDMVGKLVIDDIIFDDSTNIPTDSGNGAALVVGLTQPPTDLTIKKVEVRGQFDRGIWTSIAPTGRYDVSDNYVGPGYRTAGMQIRSAQNIRYERNTVVANGVKPAESFSSANPNSLIGDKRIGALFRNNTPGSNDSNAFTTANRPSGKIVGETAFDSDLGKTISLKTLGSKESETLVITAGATTDGNVTVKLGSNDYTVAVLAGDTITQVADKVRARVYLINYYYAGGTPGTDTIIFISAINGDRTGLFSFSGGTTGAAGTFTQNTPQGTNDVWVDGVGTTV